MLHIIVAVKYSIYRRQDDPSGDKIVDNIIGGMDQGRLEIHRSVDHECGIQPEQEHITVVFKCI